MQGAVSLGRILGRLFPLEDIDWGTFHADKINENLKPVEPVSYDAISVGAVRFPLNVVNRFGGCFPDSEHERLLEVLIDTPVRVHRSPSDTPKIAARVYFARLQHSKESGYSVEAFFYWLTKASDVVAYPEVLVAFLFTLPRCSICRNDIRTCMHEMGESYPTRICETNEMFAWECAEADA